MKRLLAPLVLILSINVYSQSYYNYVEVLGLQHVSIDLESHYAMYPEVEFGINDYLSQHLKYPEKALEKHLEAKIVLSYMVSKTGKVKKIKVIEGHNKSLIKASKKTLRQTEG